MVDYLGEMPKSQLIKCWGCEEDHMYKDCPHKGERIRHVHNIQEADIVEDMGKIILRIYEALDKKNVDCQSHM
jgi:hypothetical protein